VASTLETTALY